MNDYRKFVTAIEQQSGVAFRRASREDLALLRALGLPDQIVAFFADHEPTACIDGPRRLWPISEIVRENRDFVPGCHIHQHGYAVFATSVSGDPFCFDLNDTSFAGPRIVKFWHDVDHESMAAEQVHEIAQPIASNLGEFLSMFLDE